MWNFPDGPRQTPSLQGRLLSKTAPFHWNGEFNDLLDIPPAMFAALRRK